MDIAKKCKLRYDTAELGFCSGHYGWPRFHSFEFEGTFLNFNLNKELNQTLKQMPNRKVQ